MSISTTKKNEMDTEKQKFKILVVDDEPAIRRNIEKTLEKEGYSIQTATNAEQAVHEIDHHSFDLLILDTRMPDAQSKLSKRAGVDVLQRIRASGLTIPVIILSATYDINLIQEIESYNQTLFFNKSEFSSKDLVKVVREFLTKV